MNAITSRNRHKSFVLGFNDIKVKEQIQTLYKVSSNDLEFQTQIQDIKKYTNTKPKLPFRKWIFFRYKYSK